MLRKILVACVAVAAIATLAVPADAATRKKVNEDGKHDPALRTFFRGENWYWRGQGWVGVGLYPHGIFSDDGCWKNKHLGPPWRGKWVCR